MISTRRFAVLPLLAAMSLGYVTVGCHGDHEDDGGNAGYHDRGTYNDNGYNHGRYDDQTNYDRHQYDRDFH